MSVKRVGEKSAAELAYDGSDYAADPDQEGAGEAKLCITEAEVGGENGKERKNDLTVAIIQ